MPEDVIEEYRSSRICVDYRKINGVIKKGSFYLPKIDDLLDVLLGSKYFSTMGLKTGYWQVGLHSDDGENRIF